MKLEGRTKRVEAVRALVDCESPVMGHLGLTPQSVNVMGGFKMQGPRADDALRLLDDAHRLQEAGCFALVLKSIPAELAARATESLTIPTIGIGAGPNCSGQVLVLRDVLSSTVGQHPNFVRAYAEGFKLLQEALSRWGADVRDGAFPTAPKSYRLPETSVIPPQTGRPPTKREIGLVMQTITTVAELRRALGRLREGGKRVGFVPTMGYLHDGHLALVEASRAQCDVSSSIPLSSGPTRISAATSVSTT